MLVMDGWSKNSNKLFYETPMDPFEWKKIDNIDNIKKKKILWRNQ